VSDPGRTVFRPRRARQVVYPVAAALVLAFTAVAVTAPTGGENGWPPASRVALVLVAVAAAYFLHRLADVRVVAEDRGVTVVNVVQRRRLDWAEIVGVRLLRDDPWMMLDLADGQPLAAMGVQKSDGKRAQEQAARFARMVAERTRTPHDR
jgi:hypothetical protein